MSSLDSHAAALFRAIDRDLSDFKYVYRKPGKSDAKDETRTRRPYEYECEVYVFPQLWGSTALGFGGIGGAAMTTAYTTVVIGPNRDAAVYFAGRLAYHVPVVNKQFMEDLSFHFMTSVGGKAKYND